MPDTTRDDLDLLATPIGFTEEILGVSLYPWQDKVLSWFEACPLTRVKGSLMTPNGAGKSERIVASLTLWWESVYPQGKVVITTKSGLQLDSQVMPAIKRHQAKFPEWKFNEREVRTPTGGLVIAFTTDEPSRAEGHHTIGDLLDGPVLIIVDEAKSVPEEIFEALDRCTFAALLYVSSPGGMSGRFYDSQTNADMGFKRLAVGLADCPHIPQSRIDDILRLYGADHPFTQSTLYGKFMPNDGESRFDLMGLKVMQDRAEEFDRQARELEKAQPAQSVYGTLEENNGRLSWLPGGARDSWVWCCEQPIHGCSYIAGCDPMTGAQSAGSKMRDTHAAGIIREAYTDGNGLHHPRRVVAVLHHEDEAGEVACRWDNDILSERLWRMIRHYGGCICICEANNAGVEVLRLLSLAGANLWKREKRDHKVTGKKMDVVGFQTSGTTKSMWVGQVASHVREQTLVCEYPRAVRDFAGFILDEAGRGGAQKGSFDDFVTGIGLGLYAINAACVYNAGLVPLGYQSGMHTGMTLGGVGGQAGVIS